MRLYLPVLPIHPAFPTADSSPTIRPRSALVLLCAICALACALAATVAAPAGATPQLTWSAPAPIAGGQALSGVSCASRALCVAVGKAGSAFVTADPAAGTGATWREVRIPEGGTLSAVSCPTSGLCVAVDEDGKLFVSTSPALSWVPIQIDGTTPLSSVSCPSNGLCVAVDDEGKAFVSTDPAAIGAGSWQKTSIDGTTPLSSVSCPSNGLCAAVDTAGNAIVSTDPSAGGWYPRAIDAEPDLTAVSCETGYTAGTCVAVDDASDALASTNPTAGLAATWSSTPVSALGSATAVSCAASTLCVATNGSGASYASDTATAAPPTWAGIGSTPGGVSDVSCVGEGLCVAVDSAGQAVTALTPPPSATTGPAVEVMHTTAELTGTANPGDTTIASCDFEYGTTTAYGTLVQCSSFPSGSTPAAIRAGIGLVTGKPGLTPNTTYYYRLVVSTASGLSVGAPGTFTTLAPNLVEPHPSIGGIPAQGQRLTCKSGVTTTTGVTLSYAWLRNTQPISGATEATYTVASADVSNDLQCRVTATTSEGSKSAASAFVTVPAGGLNTVSETNVGSTRVSGENVSVPVQCSAQADGSCKLTLTLTVQESLQGSRVVAVAASARRKTVTIGSKTVRLKPGQRQTVTVTPNSTGRRLIAHMHALNAKFNVKGTVVGAISASLKSATVTLKAPRGKR